MARLPLSQNDDYQLGDDVPDVRGWDVYDGDRRLGRIDDLIINTDTGRVETAVLDSGERYHLRDLDLGDGVARLTKVTTPGTNPEIYHEPDRDTERPGDLDGDHRRADPGPKRAQYIGEYQSAKYTKYSDDADDAPPEPPKKSGS